MDTIIGLLQIYAAMEICVGVMIIIRTYSIGRGKVHHG